MRRGLAVAAVAAVAAGGVVAVAGHHGSSCVRSRSVIRVDQDGRVYTHARDAIAQGKPVVLHKGIPGKTARENRDAWHRAQGDRFPPRRGFDRDEYPPAMSFEGGADTDLRYVPSKENRDQGDELGKQTARYCTGQPFRYVNLPGR